MFHACFKLLHHASFALHLTKWCKQQTVPGMQEITHRVVVPELAFTGDTTAEFITDPANEEVFKARLLIMECSFLDDAMSPDGAKVHCVFLMSAYTSHPLHLPRRTVCYSDYY